MAFVKPLPPHEDEWYRVPSGFETAKPGTILRIRVAPGNLLEVFTNSVGIYNILFRTTDSNYGPSWAVTTLFVPKSSDGRAMLSYQIPYNTSDLNGSPSHIVHKASPEYWPQIIDNVQNALGRGWYVNFPDHEGHLAAFWNGITEGHATLDSVRAVLNAGFGMDHAKTRVALWGFSGGAIASGWAAELQAHYAPELDFAGAALGGMPSKVPSLVPISGSPFAGLIPQFLLGITAEDSPAFEHLVSQLKPSHKDNFLAANHYDISKSFATFAGQDIFGYFSNGQDVLQHPLIQRLISQKTRIGNHGIPKMPLFLYKSIHDELTPIADVDELVERWGASGVNILYERNTVGTHLAEARSGQPRAMEWLQTVLDGTFTHTGCTVRDVMVAADNESSSQQTSLPGARTE